MKVTNYANGLFEILEIIESWLHLTLFDIVDNLDHTVVHRGRAAHLAAIIGHCSVDGIHLRKLAFLNILQHAGL